MLNLFQLSNHVKLIEIAKIFFRRYAKNHYEILKLRRTCTAKDVKEAYIKLSKEYHPDCTENKNFHKKFIKITEAYNVLSKPDTRKSYDRGLSISPFSGSQARTSYSYDTKNPFMDNSFRDRNREDEFYETKPYYGIKGVERVPNAFIVIFCICVAICGVGLQVLAIRRLIWYEEYEKLTGKKSARLALLYHDHMSKNSVTLRRDKMIEISKKTEADLAESRRNAEINGNERQLDILSKRFEEQKRFK